MKKILFYSLLISFNTLDAAEVAISKDSITINTVEEKISIIEEKTLLAIHEVDQSQRFKTA